MNQVYDFIRQYYETSETAKERLTTKFESESTVNRIEFVDGKGIFVYLEGEDQPVKGCPTPDATLANNIVKRIIYSLRPYSIKDFAISLDNTLYQLISPYFLKREYMTHTAVGIYDFAFHFFDYFSINTPDRKAKIIAHIFEYDNAYRYRLQDLLAETDKESIVSFWTLRRLAKIAYERDDLLTRDSCNRRVGRKNKIILTFFSFLVLIPKYRRAAKYAISKIDWSLFDIDESDSYWMKKRGDYSFGRNVIYR